MMEKMLKWKPYRGVDGDMYLNEKLAELREDMGLTQEQLGDKMNIARSTISGYENGTSQPSYAVLVQLADFFGVSLDYLFGRTVIQTSMKSFEGQLKTKRGMIPIDMIFRLNEIDKEVVGMLLYSYMIKSEYND